MKILFLDFDGVVINSAKNCHRALCKLFENRGLKPLTFDEWIINTQGNIFAFFSAYFNKEYSELEKEQLLLEYRSCLSEIQNKDPSKIFDFAFEAVSKLSSNFKIIVISASPKEYVLKNLREFELESFFFGVHGEVLNKAEFILDFLKKENISKEGCLIIGDMQTDILAGQKAGIDQLAVFSGFHSKESLEKVKPSLGIFENLLKASVYLKEKYGN